jgi:hypothetical protein
MINLNFEKNSPKAFRFYCFFGGKTKKKQNPKKVEKGTKIIMIAPKKMSFVALLCSAFYDPWLWYNIEKLSKEFQV